MRVTQGGAGPSSSSERALLSEDEHAPVAADAKGARPCGAGTLVHAGSMFGHELVLLRAPWTVAAVAVTKVHVFVHPAEPFRQLLESNAAVRRRLMLFAQQSRGPAVAAASRL